jgi:biopolymer transport protein ExbB/TolQ
MLVTATGLALGALSALFPVAIASAAVFIRAGRLMDQMENLSRDLTSLRSEVSGLRSKVDQMAVDFAELRGRCPQCNQKTMAG